MDNKPDWVTPPEEMVKDDNILALLVSQRKQSLALITVSMQSIELTNIAISERMKEIDKDSDYLLPRETLTPNQAEALECICSYYDEKGYSPTVNELCEMMSMTHRNSGVAVLTSLINKGYLRKTHGKWRGIVPLFDHNQTIIKHKI